MKMEQTECSKTSAYKIQTPGNYPEENIEHTEHGECLKSRSITCTQVFVENAQILNRLKVNYMGLYVHQRITREKHVAMNGQLRNLSSETNIYVFWLLGRKSALENRSKIFFFTKSFLNQYGFTANNTADVPNPLTYKLFNASNPNYQERNKHSTLT